MSAKIILIAIIGFISQRAFGQLDYSDDFLYLLEHAQIDFYEPVEGKYKAMNMRKDVFQPCDYGIRSRKEKLEIRYLIAPYSENSPAFSAPHVETTRMVAHLASNDPDAVITVLSMDEQELRGDFNADWGKVFFFKPKEQFSTSQHCKLLSLYAEGKGMALVFFLFDKPSQELDNRFLALRFKDDMAN
jgi:hypothetical protein